MLDWLVPAPLLTCTVAPATPAPAGSEIAPVIPALGSWLWEAVAAWVAEVGVVTADAFDGVTPGAPAVDETAGTLSVGTLAAGEIVGPEELAGLTPVEAFALGGADAGAVPVPALELGIVVFGVGSLAAGAFVAPDVLLAGVCEGVAGSTALRSTSSAASIGTSSPDRSETSFCSKLLNPPQVMEIL